MELDIECLRTECCVMNVQLEVKSSRRIGEIIFEKELDIECSRTECSEGNEEFVVKLSKRVGDHIL